jgi:hypothetical protein
MRCPSAKWLLLLPVLLFSLAYIDRLESGIGTDWRSASRASVGLAPDPADTPEAVVQVYAARAVRWRGYFGVHSWIAVKDAAAEAYTVYEVIGWRVRRGQPALAIHNEAPDRYWYGNRPQVIAELRGPGTDDVIAKIDAAARSYPYQDRYSVWPGPNSNTFVAHVARQVPELRLDLPPTAIGKDWLDPVRGEFIASTPSGTGYQISLLGLLGLMVAKEEGFEINLAGLTLGVDPLDLALKLPGFGRIDLRRPTTVQVTSNQLEPNP